MGVVRRQLIPYCRFEPGSRGRDTLNLNDGTLLEGAIKSEYLIISEQHPQIKAKCYAEVNLKHGEAQCAELCFISCLRP